MIVMVMVMVMVMVIIMKTKENIKAMKKTTMIRVIIVIRIIIFRRCQYRRQWIVPELC